MENVKIHYIKDGDYPKIDGDDVLLFIKDETEDLGYHCQLGYFLGFDSDKTRPIFDNWEFDFVKGEVIAWCEIPRVNLI